MMNRFTLPLSFSSCFNISLNFETYDPFIFHTVENSNEIRSQNEQYTIIKRKEKKITSKKNIYQK